MTYGDRALTALPYAMNSEFSKVLAAQMVSELCTEKMFQAFFFKKEEYTLPIPLSI